MTKFRKPRLVQGSRGWYVEYYYRVPTEVQAIYDNKKWMRFRAKGDMNRRKGEDREEYAVWFRGEVEAALQAGHNPFEREKELVMEDMAGIEQVTVHDATSAMRFFLEAWEKRGLEKSSMGKYKKSVNRFCHWLERMKIPYIDIKEITTNHVEAFLNDGRTTYGFSNREYNNTFDFLRTAFNYLVKKEFISKSPCAGIDKLKTASKKHRFYDTKSLNDITKALLASDPYCYLAAQTVYYLCIRSDKELMNFKVGNILWDQDKILLDAGGTKGKSDRYIPMDNNIKAIFLERGIDKYPSNYYVFGIKGEPSEQPFGTGFFSKRFRKVRLKAGLPDDFSVYGFKHTRIIHLKKDGLNDADIMSLTGHKDFSAYAKYLRDLGMSADVAQINQKSRKI